MAPRLLAITQLAGYVLYLIAGLYCAVAAYALLGGWWRRNGSTRVRLLWFLILPTALFVVFWFCGQPIWMVVLFLTWGVDAPYEQSGRTISAVIAVLMAVVVFARLAMGLANQRFRMICSLGVLVLAILFSTMHVVEFTSRIRGWSARGAAENNFARFRSENHPFIDPNAEKRIVEEPIVNSEQNRTEVRRFVLYYGNSPIQYVTVAPYGWWWWTSASSGPAIPIDLDRAVEHWETDPEEATKWLEEVIEAYPNSDAAQWASDTLDGLRKNGSSGTPTWRSEMIRRLRESAKNRRDAEAK